jgi:hypothetical protein
METEKKLTIFDYYKNIIRKTGKMDKLEVQSSFDSVGMLRLMSYDTSNIMIANEINNFILNKWTTYLYYYYGCDQKSYVPFLNLKKVKDEDFEKVMELALFIFPEYSKEKIKEDVIPILKNELLKLNINKIKDFGGIKKEKNNVKT